MQQIFDGLKLMLAGMGMVFTFLVVMILWIVFAAKVTGKYAHLLPETPVRKPSPGKPSAAPGGGEDEDLVAAIAAAIHRFRRERSK